MRLVLRISSFIALILSIAWIVYRPDFDSIVAAAGALVVLISSFLVKKELPQQPTQAQNVSGNGFGMQAGRDANVKNQKS